jgi:hypothetical protein
MRFNHFITALVLFNSNGVFSQCHEIFPDYIDYGKNKNFKRVEFIDSETDSIKRIVFIDSIGRITKEKFIDYQPILGKDKIEGTFIYTYDKLISPLERFYSNKKEDTLKQIYTYSSKGILTKSISWEFERKSKLRKGAPEYGDGSPYGCIPAEEDLIRYREWTIRQKKYFIYHKGDLTKIYVPYEWRMEPRNWLLSYDENSNLVEKKEYRNRNRTLNWIENYRYNGDSTITTKEYFVTYWNRIPPKEIQTTILENSKIKIIKTDYENSHNLVEFKYENGQLIEITKFSNNKIEFAYFIKYE